MRVLLGVTGGIAAYKVAVVVRRLREDGHSVRVVPTASSLNFVGRATWEALTGETASSDTFENVPSVEHIRLGQRADIVLIAPATADFLASMAAGDARDLLRNALLATKAPVVVAPAMHTEMWLHAATQANVDLLKARGVTVIEPGVGRLTGTDSGPGRLPEPEDIVAALYAVAAGAQLPMAPSTEESPWGDLNGVEITITAGGTREPIDAVRYLGNYSSGHQGIALAEAARERGAHVTVIAANVALPTGEGIARIDVHTGEELAAAVKHSATTADAVIMAAAVADFRVSAVSSTKIKKIGSEGLTLSLVQTEDVLASLVAARREGQVVVGFAAETGDDAGDALAHGRAKAVRKGADMLVVNPVGGGLGFGDVPNSVTMLSAAGDVLGTASGGKLAVAHAILDVVAGRLTRTV